jgi:hypothetical protein
MLCSQLIPLTVRLLLDSPARAAIPASVLAMRAAWLTGLAFFSPLMHAADVTQPPASVVLDEALVNAKRLRLDELRREMTRLEDQIYARYNDLNTIDKFDVVCSDYTRTGTRISRRYCRGVFEDEIKAEEGQVTGRSLQRILDPYAKVPQASVELPEPPVPKILAQTPAYRKNMRQVMEKDPQLRQWLRERAAVATQMERTRREMFGE